jgi:hypothetical protein
MADFLARCTGGRGRYYRDIHIGRIALIAKLLVTAGFAVFASAAMAVPASADPASFGDISCACQAPVQQPMPSLLGPFLTDPVDQGLQQGLLDTKSDEIPR